MSTRFTILGVPIDPVTRAEAVARLSAFAHGDRPRHVMTPNPEMLVEAQQNKVFFDLLSRSDLNLPDGIGLIFAARLAAKNLPERVSGVDALSDLCRLADLPPVFLLGAGSGIAEKAAENLQRMNPVLRIAGTYSGSPSPIDEHGIVERIQRSGAGILFVAFGAPIQDLWIDRVLSKLPNIRLAMGVGGAFDFLAGTRSRAPRFLQSIGLEWLWRLVQEPSRIVRIVRAVIVFPLLITVECLRGAARRV